MADTTTPVTDWESYFNIPDSFAPYKEPQPGDGVPYYNPLNVKDEGKKWRQYSKDGYYYFDPHKRPAPVTDVPGTGSYPDMMYRKTAAKVKEFQDLMPYYTRALTAGVMPQQQAELAAAQSVSDPYAKLMTDLYSKYGPQLNKIGNSISNTNAMNELDMQKQIDPEYFSTRALTSNRLSDLMNSVDLNGGLSANEMDAISKGLSREGVTRGTANAPSATETIRNATQYGGAQRKRELENKSILSQAIQTSNAFLPSSRAGIDTAKTTASNPGNAMFTGIKDTGGQTFQNMTGIGNSLFGNQVNMELSHDAIKANKKDAFDKMLQITQGFNNVASGVGSLAGACWVAREVYGETNPAWLVFRNWLFTKAPSWFRNLYLKNGQQFAKFISNKPKLKALIKLWMNYVTT